MGRGTVKVSKGKETKMKRPYLAATICLFLGLPAFGTTVNEPLQVITTTPSNRVQETTIVAHTNAEWQEIITSAFMLYVNGSSLPQLYTITKTPSRTFRDPIQNSLDNMGDPVLAVNPYTSGQGPLRTYLAGIEWGGSSDGRLNVWYSDNGGHIDDGTPQGKVDWKGPVQVATSGDKQYFDKPSIAVSWYSGTRGLVYVTAITPNPRKVRVYLSEDGGLHFTEAGSVDICGRCWPTLRVDNTFGHVWLFWADWETNRIHVASAPWWADTFTEWTPLTVGTLLADNNNDIVANSGGYSIKADSHISVRYNPFAGRFGITWHERSARGDTDVMFASFMPDIYGRLNMGGSWNSPIRVNNTTTGDQWHPALDFDSTGNYLVTYYDNRDAFGLARYRLYATKIDRYGGRIDTSDTLVTSGYYSDTSQLPIVSETVRTMGEYHDVWNWNGHWTASHIFAPSTSDEVCFSTVNP